MRIVLGLLICFLPDISSAHDPHDDIPPPFLAIDKIDREDPFRQLDDVLPTPTEARLASGAPGPGYWQQRADMDIQVTLDAMSHRLEGKERVTYHNNSPHTLTYLWMQLDQNRFRSESIGNSSDPTDMDAEESIGWLRRLAFEEEFVGGFNILSIRDRAGEKLDHVIVDTMMRIDLPTPLKSGEKLEYLVEWNHSIVNADLLRARGGYEWFEEAGNAIYEIAQWFPRMCAYTDYAGWQNKQFVGSGEFTLEFGDYKVAITVPDTFVVSATGVLTNQDDVLDDNQKERLAAARSSHRPMFIVTPDEALENEKRESTGEKTWIFDARDVRDFAWAASPKFIWDAMGVSVPGGNTTMAMSFYPNEGEPLWSRYSTHAVAHTIEVYSQISIPYPYPVAISVNGPVGGMEYPMICFNGPRPEEDGTYSQRTKYGLIGVVIHEVGHNWFPMIINSDERQWTWMDEGLNTFSQFIAEQLWEEKYPSRRGEARNITGFTTSTDQMPIMTNSEQLLQFGNNAYAKPATALNILRESVLGRELFDFAFREYSSRWVTHACDVGMGNCTDFHTYFNALCLASGIPSRFQIGMWGKYYPVNGEYKAAGYHCWCEFHVPGKGWVPVDLSEAERDPNNIDRYYASHTGNRVTLSTGRDLILMPRQAGPPINYFVNPYVEMNGQPYDKVSKNCFWTDSIGSE